MRLLQSQERKHMNYAAAIAVPPNPQLPHTTFLRYKEQMILLFFYSAP